MTTFVTKSFLSSFFLLALIVLGSVASQAQTTLVAYNFNAATAGTPCTASANLLALNVTSTFSMTSTACTTPSGTASAAGAFTPEATAGNSLQMTNSVGSPFFQFALGGSALSSYTAYKIYFQAQRGSSGATAFTVAFQPGCAGAYNNFGTTMTVNTTWATSSPTVFDLSTGAGLTLNYQTANCFRLIASGAGNTGNQTLQIDNFQVQAFLPTASSVALGGRVTTFEGGAISRARVSLVDGNGAIRYAVTNPFGYYRFEDVASGGTYLLSVRSKQYEFAEPTRVVSATGDVSDVDFVALPSLQDFFSPKIIAYKQE